MTDDRPISKNIRKILADPATIKLFLIITCVILLIIALNNNIARWNLIPLLLSYSITLFYSFNALLVVSFNENNKILPKNSALKYLFCGRNVHWHEIQSTMSIILVFANIPWILFVERISFGEKLLAWVSIFNIIFFALEYKEAAKEAESFMYEENDPEFRAGLSFFLKSINRFPLFLNFVCVGCLMAAVGLLIKSDQNYNSSMNYSIYCWGIAISGSLMTFILHCSGVLKIYNIAELKAKDKWITNSLLTISFHLMLAMVAFLFAVGNHEDRIYFEDKIDSTTLSYPQHKENGLSFYQVITPFYAPSESPIAFGFSCIAFILSALNLYTRAIFSRSRIDTEAPIHIKKSFFTRNGIVTI